MGRLCILSSENTRNYSEEHATLFPAPAAPAFSWLSVWPAEQGHQPAAGTACGVSPPGPSSPSAEALAGGSICLLLSLLPSHLVLHDCPDSVCFLPFSFSMFSLLFHGPPPPLLGLERKVGWAWAAVTHVQAPP